jgi:hypothetical protein
VVVFHAAGFPDVDTPGISGPARAQALEGLPAAVAASQEDLRTRLDAGTDVLVLAHGSAFPLGAWEAIRAHLERGGGLVVLGGAPFQQPVLQEAERWIPGLRQPTFARELLIGPAEALATAGLGDPRAAGPGWTALQARPAHTFALTVRFASGRDQPAESGAAGPREAVLRPLLHMLDAGGLPRACPLLEIDRVRGPWAGGRWVLATSDAPLDGSLARACILRALEGPSLFEARPVNASLEAGETPRFRVTLLRPGPGGSPLPAEVRGVLRDGSGRIVAEASARLDGAPGLRVGELVLKPRRTLAPGLYQLQAATPGASWTAGSGVWVKDPALLARGGALTAGLDWLRLEGQPFPVLGTTYMASDVHRKFLFEPDPALWDRDFALMERRGVNLVRTGLWTAWDRLMLDAGAPDDTALRALDAFVLTAAAHRIHVCFTFFAFLPPAFGGEHPYLSPQALEGQKLLLATVARRFRGCPWVHYDLINEPSYAPPDALWTSRPMGGRLEGEAWRGWVASHLGSDAARLRDLWRDGSSDLLAVPRPEDLATAPVKDGHRPRKALAFRRFTQDVVAAWAADLRAVLREAGGDPLVTLGQDESGLADSPTQQALAPSLDYTAIHSWWQNDHLLWDGVAAKVPEKPMLVQETGLMRLEDLDGVPWRTPAAAAELLERKVALGFAARGAGAVQWAWNINPYQPLDNEAVIGFFRPDGTAKPELDVLEPFSAFFAKAAPWLADYAPDPVVLILPQARVFAGRPGATEAPRRMVRMLADRFGVAPTCMADDALTPERLRGARLILVPAPEMLDEAAAKALLAAAAAGARVLVTGAVTGDAWGRIPEALRQLGVADEGRPLSLHEPGPWGWATFGGGLGEKLRRSLAPELLSLEGSIWHEPLPLEFAQEDEPLAGLLEAALKAAGVPAAGGGARLTSRVLELPRAFLVVCVNESPVDQERRITAGGRTYAVPVAAGRTRLLLLDRATGGILAQTPGKDVRPGL